MDTDDVSIEFEHDESCNFGDNATCQPYTLPESYGRSRSWLRAPEAYHCVAVGQRSSSSTSPVQRAEGSKYLQTTASSDSSPQRSTAPTSPRKGDLFFSKLASLLLEANMLRLSVDDVVNEGNYCEESNYCEVNTSQCENLQDLLKADEVLLEVDVQDLQNSHGKNCKPTVETDAGLTDYSVRGSQDGASPILKAESGFWRRRNRFGNLMESAISTGDGCIDKIEDCSSQDANEADAEQLDDVESIVGIDDANEADAKPINDSENSSQVSKESDKKAGVVRGIIDYALQRMSQGVFFKQNGLVDEKKESTPDEGKSDEDICQDQLVSSLGALRGQLDEIIADRNDRVVHMRHFNADADRQGVQRRQLDVAGNLGDMHDGEEALSDLIPTSSSFQPVSYEERDEHAQHQKQSFTQAVKPLDAGDDMYLERVDSLDSVNLKAEASTQTLEFSGPPSQNLQIVHGNAFEDCAQMSAAVVHKLNTQVQDDSVRGQSHSFEDEEEICKGAFRDNEGTCFDELGTVLRNSSVASQRFISTPPSLKPKDHAVSVIGQRVELDDKWCVGSTESIEPAAQVFELPRMTLSPTKPVHLAGHSVDSGGGVGDLYIRGKSDSSFEFSMSPYPGQQSKEAKLDVPDLQLVGDLPLSPSPSDSNSRPCRSLDKSITSPDTLSVTMTESPRQEMSLDIRFATSFLTSLNLTSLDKSSSFIPQTRPQSRTNSGVVLEDVRDASETATLRSQWQTSEESLTVGSSFKTTLNLNVALKFLTSLDFDLYPEAPSLNRQGSVMTEQSMRERAQSEVPDQPALSLFRNISKNLHLMPDTAHCQSVSFQSFAHFLVPSEGKEAYDPKYLGDPIDNHSSNILITEPDVFNQDDTVVIPFFKPKTKKQMLNEKFRQMHPWLPESLTLSKLRNLQRDLIMISREFLGMDVSTVAMAWVYVERLVIRGLLQKSNRKLVAGVCLVLAYKFNQNFESGQFKQLASCIRQLDRKDRLNEKDIKGYELQVFVWLEFNLQLCQEWVLPHIRNMMSVLDLEFEDYYHEYYIAHPEEFSFMGRESRAMDAPPMVTASGFNIH